MDHRLSQSLQQEYSDVSLVFSHFQKETGLICREGCGKCCFKTDIVCSPIELLPLGLSLISRNQAESMLEKCLSNLQNHCVLLEVQDADRGLARCSEYSFRPYICRAFGVSARKNKYGKPDFSICKFIKEDWPEELTTMLQNEFAEKDLPYIELWRKKIESLDPAFLEQQLPINQSLAIMLEKLLFIEALKQD